jgi:hypothetical protein
MATTSLITNELRKGFRFCEIHNFWRKFFKYRILRVKIAPSRSPLVDVFEKRGAKSGEQDMQVIPIHLMICANSLCK